MDRIDVEPRQGWPAIIEEQGLIYWKTELPDGSMMPYWHESNAYTLTSDEVYEMEASVRLLMEMLVEAGDYIIESNLFSQMGIPGWAVPRIKETWESEPPMLYGRFDFAYGPDGFKLLEYNADTPTALVETAVQWHWVQDVYGARRRSVEHGPRAARPALEGAVPRLPGDRLYLLHTTAENSGEDFMTVAYMVETAARRADVRVMPIESSASTPSGRLRGSPRAARCGGSSSSIRGSGWSMRSSPTRRSRGWATSRARRSGSSRSGRCCGRTRASCRCSGGCIPDHPNLLPAFFEDEKHSLKSYVRSRCWRVRARTR